MPTYTYRCYACGAEIDDTRPMEDRNKDGPRCRNNFLHPFRAPVVTTRVLSATPGIVRNPAVPRKGKG